MSKANIKETHFLCEFSLQQQEWFLLIFPIPPGNHKLKDLYNLLTETERNIWFS